MNALIRLDFWLFELFNQQLHHPWLDNLLPFVRNANTWVPFYIFLLLLVWINRPKQAGSWTFFLLALPAFTDLISSWVFKDMFARIRPCNDAIWQEKIRFLLLHRPQSFSFTSSHATNHMGLAVFFYLTLDPLIPKKWRMLFLFWAFIIGYAQVYVGVHYPADIFGGFILGGMIGYAFAKGYRTKFGTL
jgi:membrane-associated phospholipid phosphatase